MHDSVVADAGGLLVLAGLVEGIEHHADEILALDATSLLVAEYLALRHEGAPNRARVDFASVGQVVREWFPVRGLATEAAISATASEDVDGQAALALAESLGTPLVTKNGDLRGTTVPRPALLTGEVASALRSQILRGTAGERGAWVSARSNRCGTAWALACAASECEPAPDLATRRGAVVCARCPAEILAVVRALVTCGSLAARRPRRMFVREETQTRGQQMSEAEDFVAVADHEFEEGLFKEAHIHYGKALSYGTTCENYCRQMRGMSSRRIAAQRLRKARQNPSMRGAYLVQAARWLAKAEANLESATEEADTLQRGHLRMEQALTEDLMAVFMTMSGGNPARRLAEAERFRQEAAELLGA